MQPNTISPDILHNYNLLDICKLKNLNFFYIRTPNGDRFFGASEYVYDGFHQDSFVVAPFENNCNIFSIPASLTFKQIIGLPTMKKNVRPIYPFPEKSTAKEKHSKSVKKISSSLKDNEKIVLSKVIVRNATPYITRLFENLCNQFPHAAVFCFYTPETSLYIGASPELLLSAHNGKISTMSLAGTRKTGSSKVWNRKNIIEQKIVTDFITLILRRATLNPKVSEPFTRTAGNVEHICTLIEANLPHKHYDLRRLLSELSPTPALCGYPKQNALALINECEDHCRGYYGGYFGYVKSEDDFDLYVNLRSLRHDAGHVAIFAGGGITNLSEPSEEWNETEAKASLLIEMI